MKKKTATALTLLAVSFLSGTSLCGQGLHLKGQLWGSFTHGDDPAPEHPRRETTLGYVPTFSLARQLGPLSVVDLEAAYYWGRVTDGPFDTSGTGSVDTDKWYRLWARFATERLELRLGLQKIAFGPARVLRPLMWFDTLDLRDPTGQTDGVGALRLKWYPWHNLALWGWIIRPDYREFASPGGRVEVTLGPSQVGLTYHRRIDSNLDFTGRQLLASDDEEERFALDARWDGFVGLWTEAVLARATEPVYDDKKNQLIQLMIGGDYTFPWGDGVYVMVEHLWSRYDSYRLVPPSSGFTYKRVLLEEQFTLLMATIPWGFFDSIMGLVSYDWENEHLSNFLMWQRTYDMFSLHLIFYANPKRVDYPIEYQLRLPETLMGFGNGIQFMIVYNH